MTFAPALLPETVAGIIELLLAALVLRVGPGRLAHRAFAAFLVLGGLWKLSIDAALQLDDPAASALWRQAFRLFSTVQWPVLLLFAASYPRPRAWLPRGPWAVAPFVAIAAALVGLGAAGPEGAQALTWWRTWPTPLAYPIVAIVLLRAYFGSPVPARRSSVPIVAFALVIGVFYLDTIVSIRVALGLRAGAALGLAEGAVILLRLGADAFLVGMVAWRAARDASPEGRRLARRGLAGLALPVALALAVLGLVQGQRGPVDGLAAGISTLTAGLLVVYALVRHAFLDLDVKLRWTVSRTTLAGTFLAVFFVVGQLAQNVLSEELGLIAGGVAAGLLLFALNPVVRLAERVGEVAVPGARPRGAMDAEDRRRIYRDAAEQAWADGGMSPRERALLNRLRGSLGLGAEEALRIEEEAGKASPGTPA